ncbi:MAG: tetratricopeptide repeat protein [Spirochaetaceae bacterium]
MRTTLRATIAVALLLATISALAQDTDPARRILEEGLEDFRNGNYEQAMVTFRELLSSPDADAYRADAYFWIGRSALAAGRLDEAAENLEYYLQNHPDHRFAPEARYQRGRLLYLQEDYRQSIRALEDFIDRHPDSRFLPNAYYWIGESLYALGRFDRAAEVFRTVTAEYPESYRAEAAEYRLSVIELNRREVSLLKLLRWSHQEYLNAVDEFEQRERTYEEALSEYRERLRRLASDDFRAELDRLSERVSELEAELAEREREVRDLRQRLARRPTDDGPSASAAQRELLDAKSRALELKEFYLNRIGTGEAGGM